MKRFLCCLVAAAVSFGALAQADTYPDRPVKMVVTYPAGGYYDRVARILAESLKFSLGQSFVVENRVGANGVIGADAVAKSAPDGYTLLLAAIGPNAITPALKPLPYDAIRDFAPIALLVSQPNVLVVSSASNIHSVADLLIAARAMGGRANYSHNGVGSSTHLAMELLKGATGLQMSAIPYPGTSGAITAVVSGDVLAAFAGSVADVIALIHAKRLRPIAVGGTSRLAALPGVPTVVESGIAFESTAWSGLMAPRGTPPAVIAKLERAVNAALNDPLIRQKLSPNGEFEFIGGSPERFERFLAAEIAKWRQVIKENNIRAE